MSAKKKLQSWRSHTAELPDLMRTLAEQGRFVDASRFLSESRVWNGARWKGDDYTYVLAIRFAELRVTGYPTQANQDLRVLAKCIHSDACLSNYEYFPKGFPEHRKAEVSALAAEMETAFRTGAPRPFLGKKP